MTRREFLKASAALTASAALADRIPEIARPKGFDFCVMADPHWGYLAKLPFGGVRRWTGEQCLAQIQAQDPAFLVDLGDSPMPMEATTEAEVFDRYAEYAALMSSLGIPYYLVLGNHEQEAGFFQDGDGGDGPLSNHLQPGWYHQEWATAARLANVNNPPGPTDLGNYYSFEHDNALFVVLDPYRYTLEGSFVVPSSPSQWTLGADQLSWLGETLRNSSARWKFVCAHHQVGGGLIDILGQTIVDGQGIAYGRGSVIHAADANAEQAAIHALMQQYGVQFFLYGHDHVFAHSTLGDGVHYLCCGRPTFLNRWWHNDGLLGSYGSIMNGQGGPEWIRALSCTLGYTRFRVETNRVIIDWVRTGYSFTNKICAPAQAERDYIESWAGRRYRLKTPDSAKVRLIPADVDAVRTPDGAIVPDYYQPAPGTDHYVQPVPPRPESYQGRIVPINQMGGSAAVVDTVPETLYQFAHGA